MKTSNIAKTTRLLSIMTFIEVIAIITAVLGILAPVFGWSAVVQANLWVVPVGYGLGSVAATLHEKYKIYQLLREQDKRRDAIEANMAKDTTDTTDTNDTGDTTDEHY